MAYDEEAADRVRAILAERAGVAEQKMFGGLCFLLGDHMCCGLIGADLVLRLGADAALAALGSEHVREMDFTGRPLPSMIYLAPAGYASDASLALWIDRATAFVETLPLKPPSVRPRRSGRKGRSE